VLYQLSYSRKTEPDGPASGSSNICQYLTNIHTDPLNERRAGSGGEGNRTPDLLNAIQALSQLSYAPERGGVKAATGTKEAIRG
jgi:hypothetical protein